MDITDVKIYKLKGKGKLLAYANVVLSDKVVLRGIKIIDGAKGRFIAMPARLDKRFKEPIFREFYHPISQEARDELTEKVLNAYDKLDN